MIYPRKHLRLLLIAIVEWNMMVFSSILVPAVPLLLPSRHMALFLARFPKKFILKWNGTFFFLIKKKNTKLSCKGKLVFGKLCDVCLCVCISTHSGASINCQQHLPEHRRWRFLFFKPLVFRYVSGFNDHLKRSMYNELLTYPV